MSAPISQMVTDLEKIIAKHAAESLAQVRFTAEQMAVAAGAMSTPLYGMNVIAVSKPSLTGAVVDVKAGPVPGAIGTVYGGEKAFMASLEQKMAQIAQGAGLDSHR